MIVIFAVALIVVGPDKLPGLARSLAKGLMEMKKTLNQVKDNLTQEGEVLDSVHKDLKKTAEELRGKMIDVDPSAWQAPLINPAKENTESDIIDMQPVPGMPADETPPAGGMPIREIDKIIETPTDAGEEQRLETHKEIEQAHLPEKTP